MTFLARYSKALAPLTAAIVAIVGRLAGIDSDTYFVVVAILGFVGTVVAPANAPKDA